MGAAKKAINKMPTRRICASDDVSVFYDLYQQYSCMSCLNVVKMADNNCMSIKANDQVSYAVTDILENRTWQQCLSH